MKRQTTQAAAVALLAAAMPAAAADRSVAIDISPYDLTVPAGYNAVVRRIDSAARQICNRVGPLSPQTARRQRDCVAQATADAHRQLEQKLPPEARR